MVVSDTTGNVKKCRALIVSKWPWILNCPDPCHGLNLMMKDIMLGSKSFPKIGAFTEVQHQFLFNKIRLITMTILLLAGNEDHS